MSRSNRTDSPNPAVKFFEWSPAKGELRYYDKEVSENVTVKTPFTFMVLEDMAQVGGGVKRNGNFEGFWSNAVRSVDTKKMPFIVRSKQGIEAQGLYADLKDRKGLSYIKGLYIAFREAKDEPLQIGHLKFKGSAVGAWFDFLKTHKDIYDGAISITGPSDVIEGEKGDYYTPVFAHKAISEESEAQATALDADILQPFLKTYFAQAQEAEDDGYTGTAPAKEDDDEPEQWAPLAKAAAAGADDDDSIPF